MKTVWLLGDDPRLQDSLAPLLERIGGVRLERVRPDADFVAGEFDLLIMDPLGEGIAAIDIVKILAARLPAPALALLQEQGRALRMQDAYYQFARAKGMRNVSRLRQPVFLGDVQALIERLTPIAEARAEERRYTLDAEQLRLAVERREFFPYFQPKIDLRSGNLIGAEALVRWQHPKYGLLSPNYFVALVEASGLMNGMTWLMLDQALDEVVHWQNRGYDFKVAVNFSATTFNDPGVADRVLAALASKQLPPSCLTMELTESSMVRHLDLLLESVLYLYCSGVEVSIDDYGTGYSSLQQVSVIPAGEIKIDQGFVRNMLENSVDYLIVHNIVRMGHNLDMRVLAEGVETRRQAMALQRIGCNEVQVYYFSRPLNRHDFDHYASSHPARERMHFTSLATHLDS